MARNVAIYGGSFDPPQMGHIMVVSHLLLNNPEIDQVLIVPDFTVAKAAQCFIN